MMWFLAVAADAMGMPKIQWNGGSRYERQKICASLYLANSFTIHSQQLYALITRQSSDKDNSTPLGP